jgi:hypothetical protein
MYKFNVNLSSPTAAILDDLSEWAGCTKADAIRDALALYWWLAREYRHGSEAFIARDGQKPTPLVIPELERMRQRPSRGEEGPRLG